MKKLLPILSLFLVAGCAAKPQVSGVNILDEVTSLNEQLGCEWEIYPDQMYPARGKNYACVLDRFNSVMFFVEPSGEVLDAGAPAIERITLIWKQWHDNAHIVDGRVPASRAVAYVAQRFFPEHMAVDIVQTFLGERDKHFAYEKIKAKYRHEEQLTLDLHQLDIINKDRHKRLFAFPPPHSHREPEADKPDETEEKVENKPEQQTSEKQKSENQKQEEGN